MQRTVPTLAALLLSSPLVAQLALSPSAIDAIPTAAMPTDEAAPVGPPVFHQERVSGKALRTDVDRVLDLDWHERLADAQKAAAAATKPIVWIQLLGDLDGFA